MVRVKMGLVAKLLIPLCGLFIALTYATSMLLLNYFSDEQLERAKNVALSSASEVAMMFDTSVNPELLKRMVTIIALNDHVERVYMVSPTNDEVLASSQYRYASHKISQFTSLQSQAYSEAKRNGNWHFTPVIDQQFVLAYPITAIAENRVSTLTYIIVISMHTQLMDNQYAAYRTRILLVSSGFLLILIALVYALIHYFVRYPISVFRQTFQAQTSEGAFHSIELRTGDEFEGIADAFNRMQAVEQKSLEEAQKAADASKALADKKSQFLANMSHELRTPINGILGIAQLCQTTDSQAQVKQYLEQLVTSSHHLLSVVNDILDFSKLQKGRFSLHQESINVSKLVIDIVTIPRILADNKDLSFSCELKPDVPYEVKIDQQRVTQILLNLLNNAVKFTEHGGVSISIDFRWKRRAFGYLDVAITDTGIGMSDEQINRLFTPFEQADTSISRHFGGTGLGLAICKELLRLMDGEIDVESRPFEGSVFYVAIPCEALSFDDAICRAKGVEQSQFSLANNHYATREAMLVSKLRDGVEALSEKEILMQIDAHKIEDELVDEVNLMATLFHTTTGKDASSVPSPTTRPLKILLAEDNAINAMVAKTMLENLGHKVMHAKNGSEAVAAVARTAFDIVFMDIQMPVMDGYQATSQIRQISQSIIVIGLSANIMEEDKKRAFESGMNAYLGKPILVDKLVAVIEETKIG